MARRPNTFHGQLAGAWSCRMHSRTQSRQPYIRQNTDFPLQTDVKTRDLLPQRPAKISDSGLPLYKLQNPVIWTVIGTLAASWTEYSRLQLPLGDRRQWQTEWLSWAALLSVALVAVFLRGYQERSFAREDGRTDSSSRAVGDLNMLAVAVANTVAHSLSLYFDLQWALPLVTVTTSFVVFLTKRKGLLLPQSDPESPPASPALWPSPQAASRRSLNVAIAAAIPSTLLLLTPQTVEAGLLPLSITATIFLFFQTIIYIGLSTPLPALTEREHLKDHLTLLRTLSLGSAFLWTMVLLVSGFPTTAIDFSTISLVLARTLELMAIIIISLNDSPITATITSTIGVSIGRSFATSAFFSIGQVCAVAVIGIYHAMSSLPSRLTERRWLILLLVLPTWNLLVHTNITFPNHSITVSEQLHPIENLVANARMTLDVTVQRQSKTLHEAVAEYRRRYKRAPPPHFDTWYNMATDNGTITLIDEFDTLMRPLQPFWGVPPNVLRERVASSFNGRRVHRFDIRRHKWHSKNTDTGRYAYVGEEMKTWFQSKHLKLLPDMTWAHNFWDEPRVYAPYDTVQQALMDAHKPVPSVPRTGQGIMSTDSLKAEVGFLKLEHRDAWEAMRMACPVDSPARSPRTAPPSSEDAHSPALRFMSNRIADLDLCEHPDLAKSHGFVLAPAAFDLTHTHFPLFSGGVPSMASDIIYPPAYTGQRLTADGPEYDPSGDREWDAKGPSIYWKGSSTGGWATEYNWRELHRQRLSLKFTNASSSEALVTLLREPIEGVSKTWDTYEASLSEMASQFDIHIAGELVLCSFPRTKNDDTGGCYVESHGLEVAELGPAEEAWAHKYVLDIDGNGYSGRFLRLLMSNSVPVKMTVFNEWISDWIIPWVHYIPARQDKDFSDLPEIIRFFTSDRGDGIGKEMAEMGQKWTKQVITKESLKLWFLRLLMEYGRVMNDDRDNMNFVL